MIEEVNGASATLSKTSKADEPVSPSPSLSTPSSVMTIN